MLFRSHLLGTAEHTLQQARSEGSVTVGEPVMCHPIVLNEILSEEHDRLGLSPPPAVDVLYRRLQIEIPLCDYLVVGASTVRDSYVRQGFPAERITVIPYGVDLDRFFPPTAEEVAAFNDGKFRVICVAQMTPRKGIHYLLEAWRRLKLPPNRAELLLIGPVAEAMKAVMRAYVGEYTHIPHVAHDHLRNHYGRSSIFVLPSVEDGFGYVTAEAMGCGLPVVVSRAAGSADMVDEGVNGFVVPSRSVEALQEKIELLYRDGDLRHAMGKKTLEYSRHRYRWSAYASSLASHHRTLATANAVAPPTASRQPAIG